jgi:hypothetical protein
MVTPSNSYVNIHHKQNTAVIKEKYPGGFPPGFIDNGIREGLID